MKKESTRIGLFIALCDGRFVIVSSSQSLVLLPQAHIPGGEPDGIVVKHIFVQLRCIVSLVPPTPAFDLFRCRDNLFSFFSGVKHAFSLIGFPPFFNGEKSALTE